MKKGKAKKQEVSTEDFEALYEQNRYAEIIEVWDKENRDISTEPVLGKYLGASKYHLGDYQGSYDVLVKLEHVLGDDTSFLSLLGVICRRLGNFNKSKYLFEKALEVSPLLPDLNNNYANLLIDIGELDKARMILENLVKENPKYDDARTNLNRLDFRISDKRHGSEKVPDKNPKSEDWIPGDPLMLAFSDEEVTRSGLQHKFLSKEGSALARELPVIQPKAEAVEKLRMATRAISEKDPKFALKLCSNVLEGIGANSLIYANAGDAYIQLQEFMHAEVNILTAVVLGGGNASHFINLATLAGIRGDIRLAKYYLDQAAGLNPLHPSLEQLRSSIQNMELKANGKPYVFKSHF